MAAEAAMGPVGHVVGGFFGKLFGRFFSKSPKIIPKGAQDEAIDVARQAAQGFKNLECVECARSVMKSLQDKGIRGELIEVRARGGRDFIAADRFRGGSVSITQNGTHQAVRVGDTVFDNLSPDGIHVNQFLNDLHAIDGVDFRFTDF
jgi:hypothetical protein